MVDTDWHAIALAALRTEYPRIPDPMPEAVAALVDVVADRMATAAPGVTSQMVGAYSVVYGSSGQAVPLTALETMLLRPYRRSRVRSVRVEQPLHRDTSTDTTDWALRPDQADYLGVFDNEDDLL